jgi:hypothetical protein
VIPRWNFDTETGKPVRVLGGGFVRYSDHVGDVRKYQRQAEKDALAGAVQRVEALIHADCHTEPCDWCAQLSEVIAAIKGDTDE